MTAANPPTRSKPSDGGRARLPDRSGVTERPDGVRIAYDVYGSGDPPILFMPSAPIIHSRQWKGQIPYFSLRHKVIAYDGRGNGRSDRPGDPAFYGMDRILGDVEGVLDATETDSAVLVGLCGDAVWPAVQVAAATPARVLGIVAFAVGVPLLSPPHPWRVQYSFEDEPPANDGWALINRGVYQRDYGAFARFFFGALATEPHSTKLVEDTVGWALDGSPEAMIADHDVELDLDREGVEAIGAAVRCPMLIVHGSDDVCQPPSRARRLAEITGARLVEVEGAGHLIPGRHPVLANLLIRDFIKRLPTGGMDR
jgi:pimeloyl-ACP methyl ester carboxylesterase